MAEDLGWLDTNLFVHARTRDEHSAACRKLLARLEVGDAQGRIDPVVVHELTYTLTKKFPVSKQEAAEYARMVLSWDSIEATGGKEPLIAALSTWAAHNVAFADALLAARALQDGTCVCSMNTRDSDRAGASAQRPR